MSGFTRRLQATAGVSVSSSDPGTDLDWPYGTAGTYRPDANHAGLPNGLDYENFDVYSGPATITTGGQTFTRIIFTDYILVRAADITFDQCVFRGPSSPSTTDKALLATSTGASDTLVKDSLFLPQAPGDRVAGIRVGPNMPPLTALRCELYDVVDGVDLFGGDTTIEGCYIHDLAYYSPSDVMPDDQTHSDCIQIGSGGGYTIVGNNLQAFADMEISTNGEGLLGPQGQVNSAMMITPDAGNIGVASITDNWMDGGGYTVNVADDSGSGRVLGDIGEMLRNKFGRLQRLQGPGGDATCTIVLTDTCTCNTGDGTAHQNVYADNGDPILVRRTN